MSEAENENRRRIDKLQGDFEKSEIKREANEQIQEKNMQILESNIKEIIAENKAAFEKALAKNEAAFERLMTAIEKNSKHQMLFIVAVAAATATLLALYLEYF